MLCPVTHLCLLVVKGKSSIDIFTILAPAANTFLNGIQSAQLAVVATAKSVVV